MFSAFPTFVSLVFTFLHVVVPLLGAVVIASKVRGSARGLGLVGCVLLIVSGMVDLGFVLLVPRLFRSEALGLLAAIDVFNSVVSLVGLGLVIAAVAAGREAPVAPGAGWSPPAPPPG